MVTPLASLIHRFRKVGMIQDTAYVPSAGWKISRIIQVVSSKSYHPRCNVCPRNIYQRSSQVSIASRLNKTMAFSPAPVDSPIIKTWKIWSYHGAPPSEKVDLVGNFGPPNPELTCLGRWSTSSRARAGGPNRSGLQTIGPSVWSIDKLYTAITQDTLW